MRIAVTTPTGHVGSAVADFLLDFGGNVQVRLLARRADKLTDLIQRGAETVIGSQDDVDYLCRATQGVNTLFWATPPGYGSDNVRAFQNRLGTTAAKAIETNRIARVVNLSSIGADLASGNGPIGGLHDVEGLLNETACNVVHLRPGFFFENLLWQLDSIRKWGRISLPISASTRYPMLATRDISRAAAVRLTSTGWTGQIVQELHGPTELSFREVAEILTEVLGRKIVYIKCDREEMRDMMLKNAMSENAADQMLELYEAVDAGRLRITQPRSPETTTPTTLAEFAHDVIVPLLTTPVGSNR
ncbi:MAG: NAD(P)H-binding protein [Thermoguttaceae bacterium]